MFDFVKKLTATKDSENEYRKSYLEYEWKTDPWYYRAYWRIVGLVPPYRTGGSSSTILGISRYGKNSEKKWFKPLAWWFDNFMRPIDTSYYYMHNRFVSRQHIINMKSIRGKWCDCDERMFLACFTILQSFVEDELGYMPKLPPYGEEPSTYKGYRLHHGDEENKKAIDLYLWWRDELPKLIKEVNDDLHILYGGKREKGVPNEQGLIPWICPKPLTEGYEPKFEYGHVENVKSQKLQELIDMRGSLWT